MSLQYMVNYLEL